MRTLLLSSLLLILISCSSQHNAETKARRTLSSVDYKVNFTMCKPINGNVLNSVRIVSVEEKASFSFNPSGVHELDRLLVNLEGDIETYKISRSYVSGTRAYYILNDGALQTVLCHLFLFETYL